MNLRISDGTTTVILNDSSTGIVLSYTPRTTEAPNGGVNESAEILFLGTISTVRTTLQNLNKLFRAKKDLEDKFLCASRCFPVHVIERLIQQQHFRIQG